MVRAVWVQFEGRLGCFEGTRRARAWQLQMWPGPGQGHLKSCRSPSLFKGGLIFWQLAYLAIARLEPSAQRCSSCIHGVVAYMVIIDIFLAL